MTEKEKMLSGLWYDANFDEVLVKDRIIAQDLCMEFNTTKPSDEKSKKILDKLIPNMDKTAGITTPFQCDYGWNIEIGGCSEINRKRYFMDGGKISIGKNVYMGPNCGLYTANHPLDFKTRNKGLELAEPISIGDSVWIGGNVVILPGVTIGSGSVIGAGSVVKDSIPENSLAVGNPAKVIRKIEQK